MHSSQITALQLSVGLVFSVIFSAPVAYASIDDVGNEEEWKIVYTIGKFSYTEPRKPDQIFKVQYRAINGTAEDVNAYFGVNGNVSATEDGVLEIRYPRNYPYSNAPASEPLAVWPIIFINGEEISSDTMPAEITDCFFVFTVPFSGATKFEVAWAYLATNLPFHGDEVPEYCVSETLIRDVVVKNDGTISPYHQYKAGVKAEDVMCEGVLEPEHYRLVMHPDGRPFCVTRESATDLIQRWGVTIPA